MTGFNEDSYGIKPREALEVTSLVNPKFENMFKYYPDRYLSTLEDISRLACLLDIERYISSIARHYGFNFYSDFYRLALTRRPKKIFNVISEENDWAIHYRINNFFLFDPSLRFLQTNCTPYTWDTNMYKSQLENKLAVNEQTVVTNALDFNMTQVVHIPVFNYFGDVGLLRFIRFGVKPLNKIELFKFLRETYLMFNHLFEKKSSILREGELVVDEPIARLTEREHEVLTWYSTGKPVSRIGDGLSISEHTVRNHLRNIREKLGVRSTSQAILKAIDTKIISL